MNRLINFIGALLGLLVSSPLLVLMAVLIRAKLGSPVIFRQQRPGLHGRPFVMSKFRTMTDDRDAEGNPLPDEMRLPKLGRFLRSTSLDELPELFNVLKGDMNLVGPRPLLLKYLPYYTEREQLRHAVRPGITGWAQINGRNSLSWDKRLELDVWYVENRSLALDMTILVKTIISVLNRDNVVVAPGSAMSDLDEERKTTGTPRQ